MTSADIWITIYHGSKWKKLKYEIRATGVYVERAVFLLLVYSEAHILVVLAESILNRE